MMYGVRGVAIGLCFVVIGLVTEGPASWVLVAVGGSIIGLCFAERVTR